MELGRVVGAWVGVGLAAFACSSDPSAPGDGDGDGSGGVATHGSGGVNTGGAPASGAGGASGGSGGTGDDWDAASPLDAAEPVDAATESGSVTPDAWTASGGANNSGGASGSGGANGSGAANNSGGSAGLPDGGSTRVAYFIDFGESLGLLPAPVYLGHTWKRIGWVAFDAARGFGWTGPHIGDPSLMIYGSLIDDSSDVDRSIVYDESNAIDTFEWSLADGRYRVTVGLDYMGTAMHNRVVVEGSVLYDDASVGEPGNYHVKKAIDVDVADGRLTLVIGNGTDPTFLGSMMIEPID